MANFDEKDDNIIIPINEWPVDQELHPESKRHAEKDQVPINIGTKREYHQEPLHPSTAKKILLGNSGHTLGIDAQSFHGGHNNQEPMVQARVARWWKWWRSNKHNIETQSMPVTTNPNTTLLWISRTPECQSFLHKQVKNLESRAQQKGSADIYAALASLQDWLGLVQSALKNIDKAVSLDPDDSKYAWLREKLSRQNEAKKIQASKQDLLTGSTSIKFPCMLEVDRRSVKDLSKEEFYTKYVKTNRPVILLDLVNDMTSSTWTLDFVKKVAGKKQVTLKKLVPLSAEWARLEDSRSSSVEEFIDSVEKGETEDYLFDWSLPLHCPELCSTLTIPSYFSDNYLHQTSPGSLYRDSWPSLFVAPAGAVSQLHVDAFASSFWMALFEGQKRWTFFPPSDTALLYPEYTHSMDPVFSVNLQQPDLNRHPLLALTHPCQCVLKPGELLYVPSGSAHFVENLTVSLAVSSNHVDVANYSQVCEELRINGLMDPRAAELLTELHQPKFLKENSECSST